MPQLLIFPGGPVGSLAGRRAAVAVAQAQRPIQRVETVPAGEQWLSPGDALQVRLPGTLGGQVSFLGGRPLTELAPALAGGRRGVYQGTYIVQPTDTLSGAAGRPRWAAPAPAQRPPRLATDTRARAPASSRTLPALLE